MPHGLSLGLLIVVMLLAACTGTLPRDSSGGDGAAPTAAADSPTTRVEPGWLAIDLRYEPRRAFLTEGSVAFVEVTDQLSEPVAQARSKLNGVSLRGRLAPGSYDVRTYRRPCDGSCRALDPPRDVCEFSVTMTDDGANRLVVVRVGPAGRCRASDKGDVLDLEAQGQVADLDSFAGALTAAGNDVRVRSGGWPWLRPYFLIQDRVVAIGYHREVHTFEYASRAKLRRITISEDGTGISSGSRAVIIEWTQPHFYRSGRLLVLYLGDDPLVLETMSLILGPQIAGR